MQKRAALYVLISPRSPDDGSAQIDHLQTVATDLALEAVAFVNDRAGLEVRRRPGLERLRKLATESKIDIVIVPSLTALAGSLDYLVTFVAGPRAAGCHLYAHDEEIDTTTAAGAAWMDAMIVAADFRVKIRKERVRVGVARARAAGVKFGRSCIPPAKLRAVREHLQAGCGIRPTARLTGISPARVLIERDAMQAEQEGGKLMA